MSRGGFQVSSSLRVTPGSLEPEWHHSVAPLEARGPGSRWSLAKGRGPVTQALSQGHLSEAASAGGGDGHTSLEGGWGGGPATGGVLGSMWRLQVWGWGPSVLSLDTRSQARPEEGVWI